MERIVCENPETGDLVTKDIHAGTNAQAACPSYIISDIVELPREGLFSTNIKKVTCSDPKTGHEMTRLVSSPISDLELICPRYKLLSINRIPIIDEPIR